MIAVSFNLLKEHWLFVRCSMETRYYCFNSECPVIELSMDSEAGDECPCCRETAVNADEHDKEEYEVLNG